jgi:hypothetical protein
MMNFMVETECFFDGQMPSEKKVRGCFGDAFYENRGKKQINKQTNTHTWPKNIALGLGMMLSSVGPRLAGQVGT